MTGQVWTEVYAQHCALLLAAITLSDFLIANSPTIGSTVKLMDAREKQRQSYLLYMEDGARTLQQHGSTALMFEPACRTGFADSSETTFRAKVEDYLIEFFRFPDWLNDTAGRAAKSAALLTFRTSHPHVTTGWPPDLATAALAVAGTSGAGDVTAMAM